MVIVCMTQGEARGARLEPWGLCSAVIDLCLRKVFASSLELNAADDDGNVVVRDLYIFVDEASPSHQVYYACPVHEDAPKYPLRRRTIKEESDVPSGNFLRQTRLSKRHQVQREPSFGRYEFAVFNSSAQRVRRDDRLFLRKLRGVAYFDLLTEDVLPVVRLPAEQRVHTP